MKILLRFFTPLLLLFFISEAEGKASRSLKTCQLDTTLVSGFATPAYLTLPSISQNGDQVYLFYENAPGQLLAQLFNNVNGQLVSTPQTLQVDSCFTFPWDGFASPDFTKFSVSESTLNAPGTTPNDLRIRILGPDFNLISISYFYRDWL